MPSFFPRSYPKTSPLSPPDHKLAYTSTVGGASIATQMPYVPQTTMPPRQDMATYDMTAEHYWQPAAFAASCSMMSQAQTMQQPTYNGFPPPGLAHRNHQYGPQATAPILPPICGPNEQAASTVTATLPHEHSYQPAAHARFEQPPVKEEKAVGGVAAHLDYEMDQMSDYVSEMAQGMYELYASRICMADIDIIRSVQPTTPVSPAFRKFVSQILSSTRLPSSTILLGLFYLSTRMSMLSAKGQHKTSSGQVYRMLTIALLLGSKFLDDNTFQNRSWSEVTGLNVRELNTLEVEWLVAIEWNLHIDVEKHRGFMSWRAHWENWNGKVAERSANVYKLSPIDTTVQQRQQQHQQQQQQLKTFSPAPMYPAHYPKSAAPSMSAERPPQAAHYQPPVHYDQNSWAYPRSNDRSPPSAPETGPNTPEYYGPHGGWNGQASTNAYPAHSHAQYPTQPAPYHHGTSFAAPALTPSSAYPQNIWSSHGAGCGCPYCMRPNEQSYFLGGMGGMGSTYGPPQTVMG